MLRASGAFWGTRLRREVGYERFPDSRNSLVTILHLVKSCRALVFNDQLSVIHWREF